jgi:hypothetical protein
VATGSQELPSQDLPTGHHRRKIRLGLLGALAVSVTLIALYYLAPLDRLEGTPSWVSLTVALIAFVALTAHQMRAILHSAHPAVRAVQALAITGPLFLILFATSYFLMAQEDAGNFNVHTLSRTDSLYFTVTVFATVGFGDIVATSQAARVLVMVQMILNLVFIGLVVRLFLGAVRQARNQDPADPA